MDGEISPAEQLNRLQIAEFLEWIADGQECKLFESTSDLTSFGDDFFFDTFWPEMYSVAEQMLSEFEKYDYSNATHRQWAANMLVASMIIGGYWMGQIHEDM